MSPTLSVSLITTRLPNPTATIIFGTSAATTKRSNSKTASDNNHQINNTEKSNDSNNNNSNNNDKSDSDSWVSVKKKRREAKPLTQAEKRERLEKMPVTPRMCLCMRLLSSVPYLLSHAASRLDWLVTQAWFVETVFQFLPTYIVASMSGVCRVV